jgi:hypothetical protein
MTQEQKDKDILLRGYETARAWSGLITSLATGIIVFTAVFKRDIVPEGQVMQASGFLLASWILLGIAAFSGLCYLATLIPQLHSGQKGNLNLYAKEPKIFAVLQWFSFGLGALLFIYFAGVNLL